MHEHNSAINIAVGNHINNIHNENNTIKTNTQMHEQINNYAIMVHAANNNTVTQYKTNSIYDDARSCEIKADPELLEEANTQFCLSETRPIHNSIFDAFFGL